MAFIKIDDNFICQPFFIFRLCVTVRLLCKVSFTRHGRGKMDRFLVFEIFLNGFSKARRRSGDLRQHVISAQVRECYYAGCKCVNNLLRFNIP